MSWLYLFFARLAIGERWRKATPDEKRYSAALFLVIPICFTLILILQRSGSRIIRLMDNANAVTLWIAVTAGLSLLIFGCHFWARFVSVKISVRIAIVAWAVLLFMLFGLGFWDFGKP